MKMKMRKKIRAAREMQNLSRTQQVKHYTIECDFDEYWTVGMIWYADAMPNL